MSKLNSAIRNAYDKRDQSDQQDRYAFHRPEVRAQIWRMDALRAKLLKQQFGSDLAEVNVLDVGCGTGSMLRSFCEWGARPQNCVGVELLENRLEIANQLSMPGMKWHLGALDALECDGFDVVSANTVFSSIINQSDRRDLAVDMWRKLKPGGVILLFDFRYNNPRNPDVVRFTRPEALDLFPGEVIFFETLVFLPPVSRWVARISPTLNVLGELLLPFLRTHFMMAICKK